MFDLYFVGAGGAGRETLGLAEGDPDRDRLWRIAGFLDSRKDILKGRERIVGVVASPDEYVPTANDYLLCTVMDPSERVRYWKMLHDRGGNFISLLHPSSSREANTTWGVGCIFGLGVGISCDVTIGKLVIFNAYASVGHDAVIGDACSIHNRALICGGAVLGERVIVYPNATVLPGVRVGDGAVIGAGSVVLKDVPAGDSVMGVPARSFKF